MKTMNKFGSVLGLTAVLTLGACETCKTQLPILGLATACTSTTASRGGSDFS